ncbi:MAG: hypothetical protein DMG05_04355 [Acidobacteria bacterium]|nr:MAG: hypothetical protein DMG05_04355 [Acidobacteriota bacterium]
MRSKNVLRFAKLTILTLLVLWVPATFSDTLTETGSSPALVQDLTFKSAPDQTVIVIRASRKFNYFFYYPNPRLLILDIPEGQAQLEKNFIDMKTSLVDFATITQIGEGQKCLLRFEINLRKPIQYSFHSEGSNLRLILNSIDSSRVDQSSEAALPDKQSPGSKPVAEAAQSNSQAPKRVEGKVKLGDQATQPASSKTQTLINDLTINDLTIKEDSQQLQFTMQTTAKPSFSHFELQGPARLVIDISNSNFKISQRTVKVRSDLIQRIRFGYGDSQQGKLVRCVFDLARKAPYRISGTGSGLIILFTKENNQAQSSKNVAQTKPAALPSMLDFPELFPTEVSTLDASLITSNILTGMDGIAMTQPLAAPVTLAASQEGSFSSPLRPLNIPTAEMSLRNNISVVRSTILDLSEEEAPGAGVQPLPQGSNNLWIAQLSSPAPRLITRVAQPNLPQLVGEPTAPPLANANESKPELVVRQQAFAMNKPVSSTVVQPTRLEPVPAAAQKPPISLPVADVKTIEPKPAQPVGEPTVSPLANARESKPELETPASIKPLSPTVTQPVRPEPVPATTVQKPPLRSQTTAVKPIEPKLELTMVEQAPAAITPDPSVAPVRTLVTGQNAQIITQANAAQSPKYTGEPLSLELKDADLKDFFRLIGDFSGLNVVLDPDVKGSLTIFLKDVPWDQALDVVLKNNSLGKQLEGNVLRIASNKTLEDEEGQRKRLADARILAAELQTETRVLNYAKAADLSIVLKKVLSPRGDIIVDPRTNSMIISDIPGKFSAIDALIKQLDKKIKQVEIEARVIAATRDFLRDVGIQIGAIYNNNAQNKLAGAIPGDPFTRTPTPSVTIEPKQSGGAPGAMPLITNLGAQAATSGLSFFGGFTHDFLLDTIITAAERRGTAKLLSKPKIITQENIEGFVQQGVKIPVQTTINNTVSVQFFDFSLNLKVTPQITEEGTIIMNVNVENSTPDFSRQVQNVPTINTQQTKTTVLVNNGGTVVIGGVLIDNEQTNVRQVPGFGSLPLIGNLFKNRSVNKQTQELIFFISPKIL